MSSGLRWRGQPRLSLFAFEPGLDEVELAVEVEHVAAARNGRENAARLEGAALTGGHGKG